MVIWCKVENGEVVEATPDDREGVEGWVLADDQTPELADGYVYGAAAYTVVGGLVVMARATIPDPLPVALANEQTIRTSFSAAMTRSAQIKTQMDTIQAATFANNGQRDAAIKSISEAVENLNTAVRKLIRLADNRLDAAD